MSSIEKIESVISNFKAQLEGLEALEDALESLRDVQGLQVAAEQRLREADGLVAAAHEEASKIIADAKADAERIGRDAVNVVVAAEARRNAADDDWKRVREEIKAGREQFAIDEAEIQELRRVRAWRMDFLKKAEAL